MSEFHALQPQSKPRHHTWRAPTRYNSEFESPIPNLEREFLDPEPLAVTLNLAHSPKQRFRSPNPALKVWF